MRPWTVNCHSLMQTQFPHFASWLAIALVACAAQAQSDTRLHATIPTASQTATMTSRDSRASLRLLHASGIVQAGDRTTIALHFTIDDGWHMYWNGIAEEGMEPRWTLDLPTGWEVAGDVRWPVPHRNAANEFAIEHIFEHTLTLLVPVQVPKDAPLGTVRIGVQTKWIICKDVCLSEQGSSSVELRVVQHAVGQLVGTTTDTTNTTDTTPSPADLSLPRHIITRAEQAAAIPSINSPRAIELALRATLVNNKLRITLPDEQPPNTAQVQGLAFFPALGTSAIDEDAQLWTTTDRELTLTLSAIEKNPLNKGVQSAARGIVEVRTLKAGVSTREYFWLELPVSAVAESLPQTATPATGGK